LERLKEKIYSVEKENEDLKTEQNQIKQIAGERLTLFLKLCSKYLKKIKNLTLLLSKLDSTSSDAAKEGKDSILSEANKSIEKFNLTVPALENYKFSTFTIGDILFNNFYALNNGRFIDEEIKEILVCTPRGSRVLNFKQNDDLTLTGLNLKNLFLRTNSTLGLIIEIKIKAKRIHDYKFLEIKGVESNTEENFNLVHALKEIRSEFGIEDILISKSSESDLVLKIRNKELKNCVDFLKSTNISFEQINKDEYLKNAVLSKFTDNSLHNENVLRKLKINLHKKSIPNFIKKAELLAQKNQIDVQYMCSYLKDEIEIIVKTKDDMEYVDKAFKYIEKIHNMVLKAEGNIFGKNNFYNFFLNKIFIYDI